MAPELTSDQLLLQIADLLRTMPARNVLSRADRESLSWLGSVRAVLELWNSGRSPEVAKAIAEVQDPHVTISERGTRSLSMLLYEAQHGLLMKSSSPLSVSIPKGAIFEYFDEIRKAIEQATSDLLFVDPYLDADFVSSYLPHAKNGSSIRLLTSTKRIATLLPSVDAFSKQYGLTINVRTASNLHDRFLFVDQRNCYQSGASFKDGAKGSPTVLVQIVDSFAAMWSTYDSMWNAAKVER